MNPTEQRPRLQGLRRAFEPLIRPLMHFYWRFSRGTTLGARAVVIDGQGRIFLIKHSYVAGWHLPGGGVETGETIQQALARELAEEGNIRLIGGAAVTRGLFQQAGIAARSRGAVCGARLRPGCSPPSKPRDHRARLLRARCLASRYRPRNPRPHCQSARRRYGQRSVVNLLCCAGRDRGSVRCRSRIGCPPPCGRRPSSAS